MKHQPRVDINRHLGVLKDFQRNTVEYLFQRMYLDLNPATRFLVADEVGLETLVARGLIAKAIDWLRKEDVGRIDVVYVGSNSAIAAQNLARLNILEDDDDRRRSQTSYATRLTLLPIHVRNLSANAVNFISFTPGTSDMRSNGGTVQERALLFWMMKTMPGLYREGVSSVALRGEQEGVARRQRLVERTNQSARPGDCTALSRCNLSADAELWSELNVVAELYRQVPGDPDSELSGRRYRLVGRLRAKLAHVCLEALEPDLVIMDEFQRFKHLLDPRREEARLAQQMFSYQHPDDPPSRVLLLSATPYKMYTVSGDSEDQHYRDFIDTLRFLVNDDATAVAAIEGALSAYRAAKRVANDPRDPSARQAVVTARDEIQARLMNVMVRTERVSTSQDRNAMVREDKIQATVETSDLRQAVSLDGIAQAAGARDIIEYWKSAPYLLNFMKGYDLQRRLANHQVGKEDAQPAPQRLVEAVQDAQPHLLRADAIAATSPSILQMDGMRALAYDVFQDDLWGLLWLPPSMPYLQPTQAYDAPKRVSKTLVFSAWNVVPDAIAALCRPMRLERRMLADTTEGLRYERLTKQRRGLLRFAVSGERFAGMGALLLGYPSPTLARPGDPLTLALKSGGVRCRIKPRWSAVVSAQISQQLGELSLKGRVQGRERDPRWYWVAVAALDAAHSPSVLDWLKSSGAEARSRCGRAAGREWVHTDSRSIRIRVGITA